MAIGEAGFLQANTTSTGQPISVTFTEPLTDPAVALFGTNFGGNKFSFRVIDLQLDGDGNAIGFRFTIDEWENHDGPHPRVEDINWIAVEAGVHTLPDGRTIEAGYVDADDNGEPVVLQGDYGGTTPTVLTTVASDRFASNVDSDPFNISSTGFTVNVEEAESQDGSHGLERVGWISVEQGTGSDSGAATNVGGIGSAWVNNVGLGASFADPVTVGETQTQADPDTGNVIYRNLDPNNIDLRFEEDTSSDPDENHIPETVGLVTFERGLIMCFTPGTLIATPRGDLPIEKLAAGDLVLTRDAGVQPLRLVSRTVLSEADLATNPKHRPILIRANAIAPGWPIRDTLVSPQHRLLIGGWRAQLYTGESEVLVPAAGLLNDTTVLRQMQKSVTYLHLLFDTHQIILADGMWSESLHPGSFDRDALDKPAQEELFELFSDLRTETVGFGQTARPALTMRQASVFA